ncbi:MAG: DUF4359 domain-containing protein [Stenomitos rutilans HA7619-LM2]|jgi:hypothetical protein|nr:DUF4359 domain-containing protein [Stenomitos rutilans HA7619-LM2]
MKPSLLLAVIASLLVATNPGEDAYAEWLTQRIQVSSCQPPRSPTCYTTGVLPHALLKSMLKQYSYRRNFIFFSVYTTALLELQEHNVGIGGFFLQTTHLQAVSKETELQYKKDDASLGEQQ